MAFRPQDGGDLKICIKSAFSAYSTCVSSYYFNSNHRRRFCKKVIGFEIFKGFMPPDNCNTVCAWFAPAGQVSAFPSIL
jgi:hypothetical protein